MRISYSRCCFCTVIFALTFIMLEKKGVVNQLISDAQDPEFLGKVKKILTSSKAQLEFYTMLGIILNGMM